MRKIKYSVVIPHKNSPSLLKRCLNSIPKREDIQIIVVDDKSDGTEYLGKIVSTYDNIELLLTSKSKGAGFARNVGLAKAIGKWVLFADADDFYNKDAFNVLDRYENSNIDILYFNVNSVDTHTLKKSNRDKNFSKYINLFLSGKEKNGDSIRYRKWEPWNKMFKREFIVSNAITFDEIPRCNDMSFSLRAGFLAKKIDVCKEKLYCVTNNPNSITKSVIKKDDFWYCILCEIKKNYLYTITGHYLWKSNYIFIIICLLKNNGLFPTIEYLKMLFDKRDEIKKYKSNIKYFFK